MVTNGSKLSVLIQQHVQAIKKSYETLSNDNNEKDFFLMGLRTALQEEFPSALDVPHIDDNIISCIGQTSLVRINKLEKESRVADVVAKVEFTNPGLR
jgi:hypothetical protein